MKKLNKRESGIMDTIEAFYCGTCACSACSVSGCGGNAELNAMNTTSYSNMSSEVHSYTTMY